MKAIIIAGGRGTRIAKIFPDIPKPMIPIGSKPVLEHEIKRLKEYGIDEIIITVCYKANVIKEYFGDGEKLGVSITYFEEKEPLGNAGALFRLKDHLTEDFLLLNADSIFNMDLNGLIDFHQKSGALATVAVHPNSHPFDSGLIFLADDGRVIKWLSKEDPRPKYYKNIVNAGIHILSPKLLEAEISGAQIDLDRDILRPLANSGKLYAYQTPEYIKDMGTPERLNEVIEDFECGLIEQKSLARKQKAVFLDRDGTINKYVGFLTYAEQFELLPKVADAIKILRRLGYLVIVITNQPVIARGETSLEELENIHKKMETLLGKEGAFIDDIFYCPHHPDKGFEGEVERYKINCDCRKPKPGLILKAAKKYNIDLAKSWMVGDSESDVQAGRNAGCKTCLLTKGESDINIADTTSINLADFAMIAKRIENCVL